MGEHQSAQTVNNFQLKMYVLQGEDLPTFFSSCLTGCYRFSKQSVPLGLHNSTLASSTALVDLLSYLL